MGSTLEVKATRVEKIIREKERIIEQAQRNAINSSKPDYFEDIMQNNQQKLEIARAFARELRDAILYGFGATPVLTKSQLRKALEKSDFSSEEFEGEFVKIYLVTNYPGKHALLAWTKPLSDIK